MIPEEAENNHNEGRWAAEWAQARGRVLGYCINALHGDYHTAEDITQQVALRSLRHFRSYRGESKFLNWVLVIARNLVNNEFRWRKTHANREQSLTPEDADTIPATSEAEISEAFVFPTIHQLIAEMIQVKAISEMEGKIMRYLLKEPPPTRKEMGEALGIEAGYVAKLACCARPKFYDFLLQHHQECFGGAPVIAAAFAAARQAAEPLSPSQIEAFEWVVVKRRQNYRKVGWVNNLRAASQKVMAALPAGLLNHVLQGIVRATEKSDGSSF